MAVETGPEIAAAAGALVDELRRRVETLAPRAKVTWIPPARLHLTLRFIGHVDAEQYRAIASALAPRLDVQAADLSLAGAGSFPRTGPPRVLWAGVAAGLDTLQQLEREVTGRLVRVGVAPEDRPYHPHLTLARIREAGGLRAAPLLERHHDTPLGTTRVETITLFESRLSPKGPTYVPLQRTPLA